MKNIISSGILFALSLIVFTSCENDTQNINEIVNEEILENSPVESILALETFEEDIDEQISKVYEDYSRGPLTDPCVTVTYSEPQGTFPNTITMDFGADGCTGPGGNTRYGQIIFTVTDSMKNAGAELTAISQDFKINAVAIDFTKNLTNNGLNDQGHPSFTRFCTMEATFQDGATASRTATHTRTKIKGADTEDWFDDVIATTGTAEGVGKNGVEFTKEIIQPLIKKRTCPFISAGIVEMERNDLISLINYGDGDCDKWALLTKPDGTTKVIDLSN